MSFISFSFAFFFAIFAALYYFCHRLKNNSLLLQRILLLAASIFFYAFADFKFLPFLLYAIAVCCLASICIGGERKSRLLLIIFVAAALAPLLFFKYAPQSWHERIIFPLGLSFFTFQSLSFIFDCHSNKIKNEKNILDITLFITFFPVISSGPIQRAPNLIPQFKTVHAFDYDNVTDGMRLFAWGIFKKIYVADKLALYVNFIYKNPSDSHGLALLLATILYSFQIYCDFSGYSDMAIGAARILGFDVGKNFDHPYLSQSVGEFWRRWHISLSSWLKDYVYIPLGGSRVALPRIYINLIVTFLVSGIWHGSTWNFVIWGLLHGLFQCAGRASKPALEKIKIPAAIKVFSTFCLVSFAWIFFRAADLNQALSIIRGFGRIPSELAGFIGLKNSVGLKDAIKETFAFGDPSYGFMTGMTTILLVTLLFITISVSTQKKEGLKIVKSIPLLGRWALYIILTFLAVEATTSATTFIYQIF